MGHYDRKNPCPKCNSGEWTCKCPIKKEKPNKNWMVDTTNYEVMKVTDFDQKYSQSSSFLIRMHGDQFKTKKEAQIHRDFLINQEIDATREYLAELEAHLNKKG